MFKKKSKEVIPAHRTGNLYVDEAEKAEFLEKLRKSKQRKRIITTVVVLLVVFIAAFVVYKVAFGDNKDSIVWSDEFIERSDPQKALGSISKSQSYPEKFAEVKGKNNTTYALKYTPYTDLLTVEVKNAAGTTEFRSWPEALEGEKDNEGHHSNEMITSPVIVGYTKSGMDGGNVFGVRQMEYDKVVNKIKNGLQLHYTLKDINCSFYVEFTLDKEGNLCVSVPANGIVEPQAGEGEEADKMPRLASLTVLPYMDAARKDVNGCIVTPDGSGALTYFDVARIANNEEYSKRIYGYDYTFDKFNTPDYNNEDVSLPVFGIIKNIAEENANIHTMLSSFVTKGEASASIIVGNPGVKNLNFYYVSYKFNIREFYYNTISKNGDVYTFLEEGRGVGDFALKYSFDVKSSELKEEENISKNGFTYVDLAVKTRDFIKEKWGIEKKVDTETNNDLINLKVLLGAENVSETAFLSKIKVMTTFSDVKSIYNDLNDNGASNIRLSLLGWQNDGYYGNITKKYSIESAFGGKSDLKDLNKWAAENGISLSADNNLLQLYGTPKGGASLRKSVVKEPGTSYLSFKVANSAGVYREGTEFYYMSPLYYNEKYLEKDIDKLDQLGFNNVDLQQLGNLLYTDYNKKNALLRQQGLNYYQNWINKYQENFNEVSVYYGFDYAVKNADMVLDIPTNTSSLFILDETVPFMQIVYHGLVDYYCAPLNRDDHPDVALLKAIEYGCLFSYEVTKENTVELKYTYYNDLFKSEFGLLKDDIIEAYKIAESTIAGVRDATIVNHYRVDDVKNADDGDKVYCTEYSNGKKIYVNYGDVDYTLSENKVVASMNYLVD